MFREKVFHRISQNLLNYNLFFKSEFLSNCGSSYKEENIFKLWVFFFVTRHTKGKKTFLVFKRCVDLQRVIQGIVGRLRHSLQ